MFQPVSGLDIRASDLPDKLSFVVLVKLAIYRSASLALIKDFMLSSAKEIVARTIRIIPKLLSYAHPGFLG